MDSKLGGLDDHAYATDTNGHLEDSPMTECLEAGDATFVDFQKPAGKTPCLACHQRAAGTDYPRDVIKQHEDEIQPPTTLIVLNTIVVFFTFFCFAASRCMYGPTLVDLQRITGSTLKEISLLFTLIGVGGIPGCTLAGWLFDRFQASLVFAVNCLLLGVATLAVPLCNNLYLMMAATAMQAFFFQGLSVGCNGALFRIWRSNTSGVLLSMHILFTVGGFVVPLMCQPFLSNEQPGEIGQLTPVMYSDTSDLIKAENTSAVNLQLYSRNDRKPNVTDEYLAKSFNESSDFTQPGLRHLNYSNELKNIAIFEASDTVTVGTHVKLPAPSRVKYVFLILAIFIWTTAFMNLSVYFYTKRAGFAFLKVENENGEESGSDLRNIIFPWVIFLISTIFLGGLETVLTGMLYTYAFEHALLGKTQSSLLQSMIFVAYGVSRTLAIAISRCVSTRTILGFCIGLTLTSGSVMSVMDSSNAVALWICSLAVGSGTSILFSMVLIWASEFLPITCKFTSSYVMCYTIGLMTWPLLAGSLIENLGSCWYFYMITLLTTGIAVCYIVLNIYRFVKSNKPAILLPSIEIEKTALKEFPKDRLRPHSELNKSLLWISRDGALSGSTISLPNV